MSPVYAYNPQSTKLGPNGGWKQLQLPHYAHNHLWPSIYPTLFICRVPIVTWKLGNTGVLGGGESVPVLKKKTEIAKKDPNPRERKFRFLCIWNILIPHCDQLGRAVLQCNLTLVLMTLTIGIKTWKITWKQDYHSYIECGKTLNLAYSSSGEGKVPGISLKIAKTLNINTRKTFNFPKKICWNL